jgi:NAD(P)-dependent dehydrogenase (short-subunit alcohol dehydrogenase family)
MDSRFQDKVAIVTGAVGGIGAAIAARLAREGGKLLIADLQADAARAAAERLGGDAMGVGCDVGSEAQVEACAKAALDRFGRLDVIVNNAGLMTFKTLAQWTGDDWLKVLRVDLLGAAFFTKQAFLHFEGRDVKIRANAILPGAIDTPMLWDNPNVKSGAETIDRSNVGAPDDIAAAVAFLASDDAKFNTGASLAVDGGRLATL